MGDVVQLKRDVGGSPLRALAREEYQSAARFPPEWQELYRMLLEEARRGLQVLPGFSVIHEMLVERAAYTFVAQKIEDAKSNEAQVDWGHYRDYVKMFQDTVDNIFKEAKTVSQDEAFKRDLVYKVFQAITKVVADPDSLVKIKRELETL